MARTTQTHASTLPARLARKVKTGNDPSMTRTLAYDAMYTFLGPNLLINLAVKPSCTIELNTPQAPMIMPIWYGSSPRPPFPIEVEYINGLRVCAPMSVEARNR